MVASSSDASFVTMFQTTIAVVPSTELVRNEAQSEQDG